MRYTFSLFTVSFFCIASCRTKENSDKQYQNLGEEQTYKISLNPVSNSNYKYDIQNATETKLEVQDKKVDNITKTGVVVVYHMDTDSSGNLTIRINYDKIHVYTKNGDVETDADADNPRNTATAMDRMLRFLKDATLEAEINQSGKVKEIMGYRELGTRMISQISGADVYTRNMAQAQWDKVIGEGVVKKNIKDLFAFLPDSVIHVGDHWTTHSKQNTEIPLDVTTTYHVKETNGGLAVLEVDADMSSGGGPVDYMGTEVTADLKGEQEGEYKMEIKSGMLKSCEIHSKVKGKIQVMGRDVPVTVTTSSTMNKL